MKNGNCTDSTKWILRTEIDARDLPKKRRACLRKLWILGHQLRRLRIPCKTLRHPSLGGNDTKTTLSQPFKRSRPDITQSASEPDGLARGRNGSRSGILRTAKQVVVGFGKYVPTIELCLIGSPQQPTPVPNQAVKWPQAEPGKESTAPRDPYGLISRWRLQQENVGRQTI